MAEVRRRFDHEGPLDRNRPRYVEHHAGDAGPEQAIAELPHQAAPDAERLAGQAPFNFGKVDDHPIGIGQGEHSVLDLPGDVEHHAGAIGLLAEANPGHRRFGRDGLGTEQRGQQQDKQS